MEIQKNNNGRSENELQWEKIQENNNDMSKNELHSRFKKEGPKINYMADPKLNYIANPKKMEK